MQQHLVELSLSCGRRSVDQFVLVSGSPLGPMTRFYPYPFFSDNCLFLLPVGRPLRREDRSVICSAMTQVQFQVTLRPMVCRPVLLGAGPL
jgi:hypothetical protein